MAYPQRITYSGATFPLSQFTQRVNVKRLVHGTLNAAGEASESWRTVEMNIKADIQPSKGDLRQLIAGKAELSTHKIFLAAGTDIKPNDRIEDSAGNLFVVQSVEDYGSHIEASLNIEGKE